jgi:hypothetical protein
MATATASPAPAQVAPAAPTKSPLDAAVSEILHPTGDRNRTFAFADFLKREYRFGIDPSRPVCKFFIQGHCPLGNECPDKHSTGASYNKCVYTLLSVYFVGFFFSSLSRQ